MTAQPLASAAPTAHPVLLEITRTYLVWIRADTPAAARRAAEQDPRRQSAERSGIAVGGALGVAEPGQRRCSHTSEMPQPHDRYACACHARLLCPCTVPSVRFAMPLVPSKSNR